MYSFAPMAWFAFCAMWGLLSTECDRNRQRMMFWLASLFGATCILITSLRWINSHPNMAILSKQTGLVLLPYLFITVLGALFGAVLMKRIIRLR